VPPFDTFNLQQYPPVKGGQAYNAADMLLVSAANASGISGEHTFVINDEFGALCVALQPGMLWTDSSLACISIEQNLSRNKLEPVETLWSTASPAHQVAAGLCQLIIIRAPKQLAYFEHLLSQLSQLLPPHAQVMVAGMDKHLSPKTAQLLETYIGPTQRHRGERKARLFSAVMGEQHPPPYSGIGEYYCEELQAKLISLPNVFAREKIDIGSRFLIEQLDKLAPVKRLIDLACGNGIIGLSAMSRGLCKELVFCDESAMALASAQRNAQALLFEPAIYFQHGDGLLSYQGEKAELILCNPPFHLNHRVDEVVGRRLLGQAASALVPGGSLCLVANRHLNYSPTLKRHFKRVEKLAQNSKFIVWRACI